MLSPEVIEREVRACLRRLDELVEQVGKNGETAAVTESLFKAEYSKARLRFRASAEGKRPTVDEVEDRATVATEGLRLDYLIASNALTTTREALRVANARLDGLRTLSAAIRSAGG